MSNGMVFVYNQTVLCIYNRYMKEWIFNYNKTFLTQKIQTNRDLMPYAFSTSRPTHVFAADCTANRLKKFEY